MRFLHLFKFGLVEKLAMSFEVRGRWETPSYFFVCLRVSLLSTCGGVADLSAFGCCLLSQIIVFVKRLSLKINFQTSFAKPNKLRLYRLLLGLLSASAVVSRGVVGKVLSFPFSVFRWSRSCGR